MPDAIKPFQTYLLLKANSFKEDNALAWLLLHDLYHDRDSHWNVKLVVLIGLSGLASELFGSTSICFLPQGKGYRHVQSCLAYLWSLGI